MPIIEIQHMPGQPKERVNLPAGRSFYQWLVTRDFFADVIIVVNGRELEDSDELDFPVTELHTIQIFSQPKGAIGKVLNPVFKLISKVLSFLAPKQSFSASDYNSKESPNNKLTGQTNVARTYQARPDIYGQVRAYPDLIQPSMFEFINNIKYVTEWMNFGIGRYDIENVRYSESSIGSLAGASYQIYQPGEVIPQSVLGFEFDDVDGQEISGPNESNDVPVYSASATTVISGTFSGGQASVKIVRQASFDYFADLALPHSVTFIVNVSYATASGNVTKDIKVSADLINVTKTDDGAIVDPVKYYTFFFSNLTGTDVGNTPVNATVNTTKFVLNDNQALAAGPFFSPLAGDQLWIHFMAQLGDGEGADYRITLWKVNDDNSQVPGTTQTLGGNLFNSRGRSDVIYKTVKVTPSGGFGRYSVTIVKTNNSSDSNSLQIAEIHSVRILQNQVHAEDTLVRVTVQATEQATGVRDRKYNALVKRHTISYELATRAVDYTLRPSRNFADAVAHTWLVMGEQPEATIDLYELYRIAGNITPAELGYFDYTFDDEDVSLGARVEMICNAARVIAFWDNGVLTFSRDEKRTTPAALFNRSNKKGEEFRLTYDMRMPGQYDGVEVEYVSPLTNKKTYLRYRITAAGIVETAAQTPLKVTLNGCRNEAQARDRALLEVRKLLFSRLRMSGKVLADGEYVYPGDMIIFTDTYDINQQDGYIVARRGNIFDTSERISFEGEMWVVITDSIGNTTARYPAYPRSDTDFGFTAAIPAIQINIFDGVTVQSPSRYVIATQAELDSTQWTIAEKKPNTDGTTTLTLTEYSDLIYS